VEYAAPADSWGYQSQRL